MSKRFLQAPTIYLGNGEKITDGTLIIKEDGSIEAVGKNIEVPAEKVQHFDGALCPGFINTHCHLELSHLKNKVREKTKLNGFIKELQSIRFAAEEEIKKALDAADLEMQENGIVAVGDICNDAVTFKRKASSSIFYHSLIELFAFDPKQADAIFQKGLELKAKAKELKISASIVPHAPYSVSDPLFEKIAELASNSALSIHNQETEAENSMFQHGSGAMIEMLSKFGLVKELYQASGKSSLQTYLEKLPQKTPLLLVHNTFTSADDIQHAEEMHKNLYWCFCPLANSYIEDRLPNVPVFVQANVRCTLGTDSLASNHHLSILEEMKCIQQSFPEIDLATLCKWACQNGADF
ncbi:MAG: amidohydrolase family protein, partial [Vicingaceae bacterium]